MHTVGSRVRLMSTTRKTLGLLAVLLALSSPVFADFCPDEPLGPLPDVDLDGTPDCADNCPRLANDQTDSDGNGVGDACDCGLDITTTADGNDGECVLDCTLREAVSLHTADCAIRVPAGTYVLTLGGIWATNASDRFSLFGDGADQTILEQASTSALRFRDSNGVGPARPYVGGLTLARSVGGLRVGPGSFTAIGSHLVIEDCSGPGVDLGAGRLLLDHAVIRGNTAASGAGMFVRSQGRPTLRHGRIESNVATQDGGGIWAHLGSVNLQTTVVRDNRASRGAGLYMTETESEIARSEISGNVASDDGGGIWNSAGAFGNLAAIDSTTIADNVAGDEGGGIWNAASTTIRVAHSTVAGNQADAGGGIYNSPGGVVELDETAVVDNQAPTGPDCQGVLTNQSFAMLSDASACARIGNVAAFSVVPDPMLGPLADNGGPTRTRQPMLGSALIDGGTGSDCPSVDQRGYDRPQGVCDLGAVEIGPLDCNIPELSDLDLDGACDAFDSCVGAFNPDQSVAVLGQTIRAPNRLQFAWSSPVDVIWVRGSLDAVSSYPLAASGSLQDATQLTDASSPAVGSGSYFLVRPACSVGSYQSEIDAEPGRDALP